MKTKKECELEECAKIFTTNIDSQRYCSQSCSGIASKKKQDHTAEVRRRFKRMCAARWQRAYDFFVYGISV